MRAPLLPPLGEAPLSTPVHLLLRDYPELLALFRREGVDPAAGAVPLGALADRHPSLPEAVVDATRWRGGGDDRGWTRGQDS